ncbi:MAG: hypothetical protein RR549_05615, partial [Oscillospiraceae bacterium]
MSFKKESALNRVISKCSVFLLAAVIAASSMTAFAFAEETSTSSDQEQTGENTIDASKAANDSINKQIESSFSRYLMNLDGKPAAKSTVEVNLLDATTSQGVEKKEYQGNESLILKEGDTIEFNVSIPEDGVYFMDLSYCSVEYKN